MTGVDLTRIDGVDAHTALKVVSEVGTDMTKWPSAKHFASWLGLSPNNRITGGRVMSSKTKASGNRAAAALRLAANALHRSGQRPGRLSAAEESHIWERPRPSRPRPTSWPASSIPCCATAKEYVDAGAEYYERQYRQRALHTARHRAAQLGYQLVPIPMWTCLTDQSW